MTKSLINLQNQNLGLATANRYVVHFDPAGAGYTAERVMPLSRQIEERFSALPALRRLAWPSTVRSRAAAGANA